MSQPLPLQTVATLTGGTSPVMRQAFFWGIPGRPFSVGTHGDWVVKAPGVEPLHFFLNFDGRMIQVASGPTGAVVTVGGVPIDHSWRPVPVFAEIGFGDARMRITCEEAPQEDFAAPPNPPAPNPPAPEPRPSVPPPNTAPVERAAPHTPRAPDHAAYERPRSLSTQPLALTPEQRAYVDAVAPLPVRDGAAPAPYAAKPPAPSPASPSGGQPQPGPVVTLHFMTAPGFDASTHASVPPPGIAPPDPPFVPVPAPPSAGIPQGRAFVPAPSVPPPGGTPPEPVLFPAPAGSAAGIPPRRRDRDHEEAGVSTVSDLGALRALATRVQTDPTVSKASQEAYFAEVQRASVGQVPAAGSPRPRQAQQPSVAPGGTRIIPSPAPHDAALDDPDARVKPVKPKTSWVMRLVMVLLPVAGYFAIFWEPPADAPAPAEEQSVDTEPSPSATASATARASTSARSPELASAAAPSATSSAHPAAAGSSGIRPSASAPAVAPVSSASEPSAALAGGTLALSSRQARDALNAAFEGKLEEAAQRYEKLATGPDGEPYRVSARLIRERAIRKP